MHGSFQEDVVGVDGLGNGVEGVGIAGDADKVRGDESYHGELGGAAVTDFGLAEEGDEGGVGFREVEGVELEFTSLEVYASGTVVCVCFVRSDVGISL